MDTMTFCVPCLFGLEGLVGDELRRLDLQNVRVEDRRVFFEGDFAAMAKANLCCRMGERVMILLAEFDAHSFEDLFQGVKAVPLERFIPKDGAFPVKGYSLNSQLHAESRAENCRDQRAHRAADEPDGHQRDRRGLCHDEDDDGDQPSDHCLGHGNLLLLPF